MSANGISTLATKRARQDAKLALTNADRIARNGVEPGRYSDTTADQEVAAIGVSTAFVPSPLKVKVVFVPI